MQPAERRRTMRVPVRGVATVHTAVGPMRGALANLSSGGALVDVSAPLAPFFAAQLQLELGAHEAVVTARTVRVEIQPRRRWRVAVEFDGVDDHTRDAIDAAITHALSAARRRPILVVDEQADRRSRLVRILEQRGMSPIAPRTPLDAIEALTRNHFHVDVALLSPASALAPVLEDSFPWVHTTEIDDDVETSAGLAIAAWEHTPLARLGVAIG